MTNERTPERFDAVRFMREARARIDAEIAGLSVEERLRRQEARRPSDPFLAALWDRCEDPEVWRERARRKAREG